MEYSTNQHGPSNPTPEYSEHNITWLSRAYDVIKLNIIVIVIVIAIAIVIVIVSRFPSLLAHVDHPKRPTDLKFWPPEAKYIMESDFGVQKSLAPSKSVENNEKPPKRN